MPSCPTYGAGRGLKQKLQRKSPVPLSEYVTLGKLATELDVELDRLGPLIQHGYLRVMDAREEMAASVVARPSKEAMDWLRVMFMPLELRPYIPIAEARQVFNITEDEMRYLAVNADVPLYNDPVFGELLSVTGFLQIRQGVFSMRSPMRTDRQMLLMILGEMKNLRDLGRMRPLKFSERLENEIRRIAEMPEPERTIRATEFWKVYADADSVTDCLEKLPGKDMDTRGKRIRQRMKTIETRLSHGWRWGKKAKPPEAIPAAIETSDESASESSSPGPSCV